MSRCPLTPPAAGFLFKALSGGISQCFRLRAVAAASSLVISSPPRAAPWFAPVPAGSPSKPTRTNLSKGKITPSKAIPGRAGAFPLQHRQPQPGRTSSGKGRPAWEGKGAGKDRGSEPGCIAGVRQLAPRVNDSSSKGRGMGSRCPFPWGTVGDPRGTSRPREGSGDQADPPGHPRPAPHAAPVSWQGWGRRFPSGHLESRNPHAVQRAGASSLSAGSRSGVLLPPCPRATPQLGGVRRLGKRREPPGSADPARHALPSRRGRMLPPGSCLAHHFTARGGLFVAAERDRAGMETGAASWVCAEASFWPLKC